MISVSDQGLYCVLYVRQAAVPFEQFAEWWTEKTLDRGGRFLSWAQETPVSVAGSGPRIVSSLRQGVQRKLQAKSATGLVPLHSGHWKAFSNTQLMPFCLDWPPPQAEQPKGRQVLAKSDVGVGYSPTTSIAHEGSCSRPSDNPALEALSHAAAAVILLLPLSQLHLLPVEVQHPGARTILSHSREEGRVEWRKERPHLKAPAPPPPPEHLRVPGSLMP